MSRRIILGLATALASAALGGVASPAMANDQSWSFQGDSANWDDGPDLYTVRNTSPDGLAAILVIQRTSTSDPFACADAYYDGISQQCRDTIFAEDVLVRGKLCKVVGGSLGACSAWKSFYT